MNRRSTTSHTLGDREGSRVLVVRGGSGRIDTLELLEQIPCDRAEAAGDLFEAVAAVGLATASDPVDTVLVPVTLPEFSARRIVDAFEILERRVRLVLLVPGGRMDAVENAIEEGFDDAIELPASPTMIRRALDSTTGPITASPAREMDPPPTRPRGFGDQGLEAPSPTPPGAGSHSMVEKGEDAPLPNAEARNIGDIDLVMSISENDGNFRATSLTMIRAHLGTGDVHLLLPDEFDPDDARISAPITIGSDHVATLASSTIGSLDLERWAAWLGTWMGLERRMRTLETLTETDQLTKAGNRRAFERILSETLGSARRERRIVTLMVFDIDNFKSYNDRFGHEAGDEVLRQTVDLLRCTIRRGDHVFRIGGDEFVVIFSDPDGPRTEDSAPLESVEDIAHRFQAKVCELRFPQLGVDAEGSLTISAGLATFPWDGHDGPSLLRHADRLAMDSKRNGKNTIRFGPGAADRCRGFEDDRKEDDHVS